jgi:hypothetical protein
LAVVVGVLAPVAAAAPPTAEEWQVVANNGDHLPGTSKTFNSYNPPSVNAEGLVVFRARSRGPQPMSGIYLRDVAAGTALERFADRDTLVPDPNNLATTFNEFPSIPRIAIDSPMVATRGNSSPVWQYTEDDGESRAGTTGVYTNPVGEVITGASLLGAVPGDVVGVDTFPYFAVPGFEPLTRFEVFPGAPAVAGDNRIVFKGNYTQPPASAPAAADYHRMAVTAAEDEGGEGATGVFYRDVLAEEGMAPVQLIANTDTPIPNVPEGIAVTFGSTAPPSAAGDVAVFVGYDDEQNPTYGGIYAAPLEPEPGLETLVGIGDPVPGKPHEHFTRFGEGLSFDGRFVGFWAAWGDETTTLWLDCPTTGNADRRAYCREFVGDDFPVEVPVHQGIFVHDTVNGRTRLVAETGDTIDDFLYWNFSGAPPGMGHGDAEPPRWRSNAFLAVSGGVGATFRVAFLSRSGEIDPADRYWVDPVDALSLNQGPSAARTDVLLDTTMDGGILDTEAAGLPIASLGIERDGFRGDWLAVTASMGEEEDGWAGVYVAEIPAR